jgi:hypothetical protein
VRTFRAVTGTFGTTPPDESCTRPFNTAYPLWALSTAAVMASSKLHWIIRNRPTWVIAIWIISIRIERDIDPPHFV